MLCVVFLFLRKWKKRKEYKAHFFFFLGCAALVACLCVCVGGVGGGGETCVKYIYAVLALTPYMRCRVSHASLVDRDANASLFLGQRRHRPKTATCVAPEGYLRIGAGAMV